MLVSVYESRWAIALALLGVTACASEVGHRPGGTDLVSEASTRVRPPCLLLSVEASQAEAFVQGLTSLAAAPPSETDAADIGALVDTAEVCEEGAWPQSDLIAGRQRAAQYFFRVIWKKDGGAQVRGRGVLVDLTEDQLRGLTRKSERLRLRRYAVKHWEDLLKAEPGGFNATLKQSVAMLRLDEAISDDAIPPEYSASLRAALLDGTSGLSRTKAVDAFVNGADLAARDGIDRNGLRWIGTWYRSAETRSGLGADDYAELLAVLTRSKAARNRHGALIVNELEFADAVQKKAPGRFFSSLRVELYNATRQNMPTLLLSGPTAEFATLMPVVLWSTTDPDLRKILEPLAIKADRLERGTALGFVVDPKQIAKFIALLDGGVAVLSGR